MYDCVHLLHAFRPHDMPRSCLMCEMALPAIVSWMLAVLHLLHVHLDHSSCRQRSRVGLCDTVSCNMFRHKTLFRAV